MSLQQSDAHRDRVRETMVDKLPAPSTGARAQSGGGHGARDRRQAAKQRRAAEVAEARALGVAVVVRATVDRMWSEAEDAVVQALYPDYVRMGERLPHRSRQALEKRAGKLDIKLRLKQWTTPEVATLRRLWNKATSAELVAALSRWDVRAIDSKARKLGLKPRGLPPLQLTGDPLCDAIRDRCRVLGIPMAELDRIAHSGQYFSGREWNKKSGHRTTPMIRAVRALGGVLSVDFPD